MLSSPFRITDHWKLRPKCSVLHGFSCMHEIRGHTTEKKAGNRRKKVDERPNKMPTGNGRKAKDTTWVIIQINIRHKTGSSDWLVRVYHIWMQNIRMRMALLNYWAKASTHEMNNIYISTIRTQHFATILHETNFARLPFRKYWE